MKRKNGLCENQRDKSTWKSSEKNNQGARLEQKKIKLRQ